MKTICQTCFHHCELSEDAVGFCGVRKNEDGKIVPKNYGLATSLALDPIEKKPLAKFYPVSKILSIGSFGCNLACPFCQNYSISKEFPAVKQLAAAEKKYFDYSDASKHGSGQKQNENRYAEKCAIPNTEAVSPEELLETAIALKSKGNIGIAFTYNEPLVAWEFVRDTARLFHENGLKNVIVTNGCFSPEILEEVLPYTDALNIDLKTFSDEGYKKLGGDFETVKEAIEICTGKNSLAKSAHVELTTLIVPELSDSPEQMREEAKWISKIDKKIPLHVTRFFPRYKMADFQPTPIKKVYELADVAREFLENVFIGNC